MAELVKRGQWGARAARERVRLAAAPSGTKIHYVGGRVDPATAGDHDRCVGLVRSIQTHHMDGNGWADVGYTCLVCSHRRIFMGRGPGVVPAANGAGLNSGHYAVCALVGSSGLVVPPDGMLHGIADAIEWLRAEGAGPQVKGHRDGYATDCPGEWLYGWIGRGCPRPGGVPAGKPLSGGTGRVPPFVRVLKQPPIMRGEDVRTWQARMRRRGWRIDADGAYGPKSAAVCRAFQAEKGLKVSGRVNRATWEAAWTAPIT